jgi:hypothetical protein
MGQERRREQVDEQQPRTPHKNKFRHGGVKFEMWLFTGNDLTPYAYQWFQVTIDSHSGALTAKDGSWAGFTNGLHHTLFNTSFGGTATAATGGDEVDTDADGIPDTQRTLWAVTLSDPYTLDSLKTDVEGLYGSYDIHTIPPPTVLTGGNANVRTITWVDPTSPAPTPASPFPIYVYDVDEATYDTWTFGSSSADVSYAERADLDFASWSWGKAVAGMDSSGTPGPYPSSSFYLQGVLWRAQTPGLTVCCDQCWDQGWLLNHRHAFTQNVTGGGELYIEPGADAAVFYPDDLFEQVVNTFANLTTTCTVQTIPSTAFTACYDGGGSRCTPYDPLGCPDV